MRVERKTEVKSSALRLFIVILSLVFQIYWLWTIIDDLYARGAWVKFVYLILTVIIALAIYGRKMNASYKLPWIMFVLAVPPMGMIMYLAFGRKGALHSQQRKYRAIDDIAKSSYPDNDEVIEEIADRDIYVANSVKYIRNAGGFPIYKNTAVNYYDDGARGMLEQVEELKKAEKFIFIEYHTIEDKLAFEPIKKVLFEKAKAGVEVRLIYDDVGSIMFVNRGFNREFEDNGVNIRTFNPISPIIHVFMNYRDHRKIMVVDGKVGFVSGYNLADEYAHITEPYGFWKDTAVKLRGEAVQSLTRIFLEMWNYIKATDDAETEEKYLTGYSEKEFSDGYVMPYADGPLMDENLAEGVYMNMLRTAKDYCYFVTPYLIITDELSREFTDAAKRGVDVRIITPGIPDKVIVYAETRSYYAQLVRGGVKIYEYTPGFVHAKMAVADGIQAVVGTINLDFRSLYLHFENAVYIYDNKAVKDIDRDFRKMFEESREVSEKYKTHRNILPRIGQCLLRLAAPLL